MLVWSRGRDSSRESLTTLLGARLQAHAEAKQSERGALDGSRLSPERKVQSGFSFALLCLAVVGVVSFLSVLRLTEDAHWVAHTDEVLAQLQLLLSSATDGEAAARGFVITGDDTYLGPFREARRNVDATYQRLRRLTSDNAAQQQRLDGLAPLIAQRMELLQRIVNLRRTEGADSARRLILTGQSKRLHDRIRGAIEDMKAHEGALLTEREIRSRRSTLFTEITIIAAGALAFSFLGVALIAIQRDFAGRRRAEQALRAARDELELRVQERTAELALSETRFRGLVSATSDVIFRMSPDWSEMRHLQGRGFIPDTTAPSRNWLAKYIHPDDHAHVMQAIREAVGSRSTFELEHRVLRVDGTFGWAFSRAIPLLDEGSEITEWFGAASDVTERKQGQIRLQAQLARLSLLGSITRAIAERQDVASIFQVVIRALEAELPVDFACICLYDRGANRLTVTRIGARGAALADELRLPENSQVSIDGNGLGRCIQGQLVHEPDIRESQFPFPSRLAHAGLRALVMAPLSVKDAVVGVLVAARREAHSFSSTDCEFLGQLSEHLALATHQAQLYASLQQTYEDLRHSQQAVMQQERLRALGQMSSGIAHDINNALSPAALYVQSLLRHDSTLSELAREHLAVIHRAIEDVGNTVSRMGMFYRPREAQETLSHVDLNVLLQQVVQLTRARWQDIPQERGIVITVRSAPAPDLIPVMGAETEIRDALTNLILNAVDAMPEGGALTVSSKVTRGAVHGGTSARSVTVEISDTGAGMTPEVRNRCLEPFFTTKGERGTGLGLPMVYGMVQRHDAEMEIESEVGRGTTVRLIFPAAPAKELERGSPAVQVSGPLRILLVDDDPLILKSLRDVLAADGHGVTVADGGQEGIATFLAACSTAEPFSLVITDLGMPNLDGRAVAHAVKAASLSTPVILLTGWGQRLRAESELPVHVDRVLSKPPRLSELRAALAELFIPAHRNETP